MTDLMGAGQSNTPSGPGAVDVADVVASAFAHALQTPEVTSASNFFALGGNSLQAAALVAQLRGQLGVKVAIRDLFRAPTVAGLAGAIHERIAASGNNGAAGRVG